MALGQRLFLAAALAAPLLAQPLPATPARAQAASPGPDPAALAARSCAGCHGVALQGAGAIAPLAGRPEAEIAAAMLAFRSGERPGTIMGRIARGYSEAEIAAIARVIAVQP